VTARKRNWEYLRAGLAGLEDYFDFSLPTHAKQWQTGSGERGTGGAFIWDSTGCSTDCSWFGFMLRVKSDAGFSHTDLARCLDEKKIGNRMLFGGNLLRQPMFVQLKKDRPSAFRVAASLSGADALMNTALFLGTYPGLTKEMMDYEIETIRKFLQGR
jgi:CDP-6-deoxy-D-xylo-4-hexulose-3-dehydrase